MPALEGSPRPISLGGWGGGEREREGEISRFYSQISRCCERNKHGCHSLATGGERAQTRAQGEREDPRGGGAKQRPERGSVGNESGETKWSECSGRAGITHGDEGSSARPTVEKLGDQEAGLG